MTINEYQQEALRTDSMKRNPIYSVTIVDRVKYNATQRLLQGLMGLCGEAGEAIDILKKTMFQEHNLDSEHMARELGDVAWYLAVSADALGYSLEDIFRMNVEKLRKRYPDGFDSEKSVNRRPEDT